jgi:nitrate reductase NapE component
MIAISAQSQNWKKKKEKKRKKRIGHNLFIFCLFPLLAI